VCKELFKGYVLPAFSNLRMWILKRETKRRAAIFATGATSGYAIGRYYVGPSGYTRQSFISTDGLRYLRRAVVGIGILASSLALPFSIDEAVKLLSITGVFTGLWRTLDGMEKDEAERKSLGIGPDLPENARLPGDTRGLGAEDASWADWFKARSATLSKFVTEFGPDIGCAVIGFAVGLYFGLPERAEVSPRKGKRKKHIPPPPEDSDDSDEPDEPEFPDDPPARLRGKQVQTTVGAVVPAAEKPKVVPSLPPSTTVTIVPPTDAPKKKKGKKKTTGPPAIKLEPKGKEKVEEKPSGEWVAMALDAAKELIGKKQFLHPNCPMVPANIADGDLMLTTAAGQSTAFRTNKYLVTVGHAFGEALPKLGEQPKATAHFGVREFPVGKLIYLREANVQGHKDHVMVFEMTHEFVSSVPAVSVQSWDQTPEGDWAKGQQVVISGFALGKHMVAAGTAYAPYAKISTNFGTSGGPWRLLGKKHIPAVGIHCLGGTAGNACIPFNDADVHFLVHGRQA
jgi:hypothetical protein